MKQRGVSPVVGLTLLLGIVAIAALGIFVSATALIDTTQQQAEQDRVQQAMVEANQQMHTLVQQGETDTAVNMDAAEHGIVTREETGEMTVESDAFDEPMELTLGTIEWEGDGGTKIAAEGGAVFRETGEDTKIVSAPPFNYNYDTNTFDFSVIKATGGGDIESGQMQFSPVNVTSVGHNDPIQNESVTVTVTSEYCTGWENYFASVSGSGAIQEQCGENDTVEAQIGFLDFGDSLESGANYNAGGAFHDHPGEGSAFESVSTGHHTPMDEVIDDLLYDANNREETELEIEDYDGPGESDPGMYHVDGDFELDEDKEFDIEDGDITLIVEGDVTGEGDLTVKNPNDSAFRIFAGGELFDIGGNWCADGCDTEDTEHLQVYGKPHMTLDFESGDPQGARFEGILYAPADEEVGWGGSGTCSDEYQLKVQAGGEEIIGAVVAYSVCGQSDSVAVEWDDSLEDADIEPLPDNVDFPPPLTYLNVAQHEIEVVGTD